MKCQVIGCDNEAEYYDEFTGHCGDIRRAKVKICAKCIVEGWYLPHEEEERETAIRDILANAERIK